MQKRQRSFGRGSSLFLLLALMLSYAVAGVSDSKAADPWSVLKDYKIASAVWSPDGTYIAYVAVSYKDDSDSGLRRASVWVMSVPKHKEAPKLRRLLQATSKQGIPTGLFWADRNRICWAARDPRRSSFHFMAMSLHDKGPRWLLSRSFIGVQNRSDGAPGPDDVYWDADSRTLLFSGGLTPTGVYVRVLPLASGRVRQLPVPHPKGLSYPKGYVAVVTLCGSLRNPKKPEFYIAAAVMSERGGEWSLWHSKSYSLRQDTVLATLPAQYLLFPRLSPSRRWLAFLRSAGVDKPYSLILHDLKSHQERVLARLSPALDDFRPALGCPFSWSPDGKRIAYADDSRIKLIRVPTVGRR